MVKFSYLTPINPGVAVSNTLPSLPDNGLSAYAVHHQQHHLANEPTSYDILLGKEKNIFNHSGNRRFRTMINNQLETYIAAPTKSSKSKLIRQVHADMQKSGYRFLRRNSTTGIWYEIEKHEAREKVSHALRDRVREQQKPTAKRRRKNYVQTKPSSSTSVVPSKVISLESEKQEDSKPGKKQKHQQQQEPLNIPTLCNDDLTLNQLFPRSFFDVATLSTDDNDIPFKSQRRRGVLNSNDDYHVSALDKTNKRLSLLSINEASSIAPKRLSLLSLDDISCYNAIRRLSIFTADGVTPPDALARQTNSGDDHSPSKALERNSIVGMSDGFHHHHTNSGQHSPSKGIRRSSSIVGMIFDGFARPTNSGDDHSPSKARRRSSLAGMFDGFARPTKSQEDHSPSSKALGRNSIVGMILDGFTRPSKSGDDQSPSKEFRRNSRNSIVGIFDAFARHFKSGDHNNTSTHLEPYSLDDEYYDLELLETDHDLGTHLDMFDAFHNVPVSDVESVDRSSFLAHCTQRLD